MYDLNEEQIKLKNELYYIEDSDEEEDIERTEEIKKDLVRMRGSAENTVSFLYGLLEEEEIVYAGRVAEEEHIKKNPLLKATRRTKHSFNRKEMLKEAILQIILNFDLRDVNLPDGSTINKKLNPGKLIINEAALNLDALPDDLIHTVPEHTELNNDAKAKIMATLRDQLKDSKGRMNQVDSFVTLDELPGFALVRDSVIQVK